MNDAREKLERKAAAKLELKRRKAKTDFWSFCLYMDFEFFHNKKHCKEIADSFQKVADGVYKKIAISMPPRSGKSYSATMFSAWMIGRNPTGSVMRNCHTATLARKFSRNVKTIIQKSEFNDIFPDIEFSKTNNTSIEWSLTTAIQTTYFCGGIKGGITGSGCSIVAILDDPIKNWQDGSSEIVTETVWDFYKSTHRSRYEGDCPEIHISTRWNGKDPIAQLETAGELDHIIRIPALDENDKSFCEDVHSTKWYLEERATTEEVIFESVYMQNPIEIKGLLFPSTSLKRFALNELNNEPEGVVGFCDTADEGTDYLSAPIGKIYGKKIYITDIVFSQDNIEITQPLVAASLIKNKALNYRFESNNGGKGYAIEVRRLIEKYILATVTWRHAGTNKGTRILMESGYIKEFCYFRNDYKRGSDYDKFMSQLTTYLKSGKSAHDDAADSMAGLSNFIRKEMIDFSIF